MKVGYCCKHVFLNVMILTSASPWIMTVAGWQIPSSSSTTCQQQQRYYYLGAAVNTRYSNICQKRGTIGPLWTSLMSDADSSATIVTAATTKEDQQQQHKEEGDVVVNNNIKKKKTSASPVIVQHATTTTSLQEEELVHQTKSLQHMEKWGNNNPVYGDVDFLRKRTALLFKKTSDNEIDLQNPNLILKGNMKIDTETFDFLIEQWAFSEAPEKGDKAEQLFQRLLELYRRSDATHFRPTVRTYTLTINALSRSYNNLKTAAPRAQVIFDDMLRDEYVKPNLYTYTVLAEAWSNSGLEESARIIERLCNDMAREFDNGNKDIYPTAKCWNAAMLAWARTGRDEQGAIMAEGILEEMNRMYKRGRIAASRPNQVNFNTVLYAWARCNSSFAAERAQQVLNQMKTLYQTGLYDCKPTTLSYNTVILAWAQSGHSRAGQVAQEILNQMRDNNDIDAKPNARTYNTVINVWAKSDAPDAAMHAEDLLEEMKTLYNEGDDNVRPDAHTFSTVINAWARTRLEGKAERAYNLLRQMKELHLAGHEHLQPNVVVYNAVMNACVTTEGGTFESTRAVEIARALFGAMMDDPTYPVRPDHVTYGTFLKVVAHQLSPGVAREKLVEFIFRKCQKDEMVGDLVLSSMKIAASPELYLYLIGYSIDDDITVQQIPRIWSRNVVDGKWERRRKRYQQLGQIERKKAFEESKRLYYQEQQQEQEETTDEK